MSGCGSDVDRCHQHHRDRPARVPQAERQQRDGCDRAQRPGGPASPECQRHGSCYQQRVRPRTHNVGARFVRDRQSEDRHGTHTRRHEDIERGGRNRRRHSCGNPRPGPASSCPDGGKHHVPGSCSTVVMLVPVDARRHPGRAGSALRTAWMSVIAIIANDAARNPDRRGRWRRSRRLAGVVVPLDLAYPTLSLLPPWA